MRVFKLLLWLVALGLFILAYIYRNELVFAMEKITHGDKTTPLVKDTAHREEVKDSDENTPGKKEDPQREEKNHREDIVRTETQPPPAPPVKSPAEDKKILESVKKEPPPEEKSAEEYVQSAEKSLATGDMEDAARLYLLSLDQKPEQPEVWRKLGGVMHDLKEYKQAAKAYGNAVFMYRRLGINVDEREFIQYIEYYAPELARRINRR